MTPTANLSDSMKGVLAMLVATLLLTLNDAVTKLLTEEYSFWQVVTLRQVFSLCVIIPYIHWVAGWDAMRVTNRGGLALRSAFFVATTVFIVASFALLPLAFVTAIAFSSPIFVVAFSHFFTSEKVGPRRWLAVLVGFLGVLVIVRPGGADFSYVLILPVMAALTAAGRDVITRGLSKTESSISILFWSNICVIAFALIVTSVIGWQAVTPAAAALLLLAGLLNASAHFLIIDSLRLGDASLVSPFRYSGLLWAIILGLLIWGDFPDIWTLVGAALLVASGIYIIERAPRTQPQGSNR